MLVQSVAELGDKGSHQDMRDKEILVNTTKEIRDMEKR